MKTTLLDIPAYVLSICAACAAIAADVSCSNHYVLQLPDPCLSAPGTIDSGFGEGGMTLLAPAFSWGSTAIQADGRIVVAGSSKPESGAPLQFAVLRTTREGVPDATFGDGGLARTAPGPAGGTPRTVIVQPDGKIVVGGSSWLHLDPDFSQSTSAFTLVRYLPDGQLDATFGDAGRATTTIGWSANLEDLLLQPDGKLVAQGRTCSGPGTRCTFALVRYDANGGLDTSFGSGGTVAVERGGRAALQPDGKLVASYSFPIVHVHYLCGNTFGPHSCICTDDAGTSWSCNPPTLQEQALNTASGLVRFNQDGAVDASFGVDGKTVTPFVADGIFAGADGKIVIAGHSLIADANHPWLTLARYASDGTLDPTFGDQGIAAYLFPGGLNVQKWFIDFPLGLQQQPDGKLVVVASRGDLWDWSSILLARYTQDGRLDPTFNDRGYVHTVKTSLDFAADFKLQADGKILVLANIWQQGDGLIRYRGDEVVEFRNSESGHYFLTVDPAEQASIAMGGSGPGWSLTGESFKSNAGTRVCRFAGAAGSGPSHFFTLDPLECELVKRDPGWRFEGYDFSALPAAAGKCPAGAAPIYRAYNNGFARKDSNHRYMSSVAAYDGMIAAGWTGEGVVFCVPM